MKLTLEGLADRDAWNKAGWELPAFDYQSVRTRTLDSPVGSTLAPAIFSGRSMPGSSRSFWTEAFGTGE